MIKIEYYNSMEVGTIILPWVTSLKIADKYFIIPLIYLLISWSPILISHIEYLKLVGQVQAKRSDFIMKGALSILIIIKAPVGIGLYFITSGIFSLIEEICYRLYMKNKYA